MRYLKKTNSKTKIENLKKKFFVFDVETTKLEPQSKNFVFGVLYGYETLKVIYSIADFKKEFNKAKYRNKIFFAHNAEFDLLTIFGNIYKHLDNKAIFNGKFILAKKDGATFADSLNIFPASVEKIGLTLGIKKIENKKVKTEGLTKKNISQFDIEYCIRDCEIVYKALLSMFESIGIIKFTLASLSIYNFRNKFLKDTISISELNDEFYESYYGGRTEAFKIGECKAVVYDINSLYPFVMSSMYFPNISNLKKVSKLDVKYLYFLLAHYEGCAKVTVKHYESYFGFLPYKENAKGKLLFPVGIFTTVVNFNEIRFAIQHNKINILHCDYAVFGNRVKTPFKEFVLDHYGQRLDSKDELSKLIHKLIPNSLYGKFAQRIKYDTEYFEQIPYELINELSKTEKFHLVKTFSEKRNDCYLITEKDKFKNSFFAVPSYSSYITSVARIVLLKGLLLNEKNNIVYCDTDSIFIENNFIGSVNNELGNYKKENKTVLEIKGLKHYIFKDENGIIRELIKGVSKNAIKQGNSYIIPKYFKTKEALRRSVETGKSYQLIKVIKQNYDKRIILEYGNTKPVTIGLSN
jgi:hypothetical protein